MLKINRSIIDTLHQSNQKNVLTSPIWIFKTEKIVHKGKYLLKVYLYQTEEILSNLKEIRFGITFITRIEQRVYEFRKVDSLDDSNAFGCLIELPVEYAQNEFMSEYTVWICSYIINNEVFEVSENQFETLRLSSNHLGPRRNFLKEKSNFFVIDPYISDNYWLCTCGKINSIKSIECSNCHNDFELLKNVLLFSDKDYSNYFFQNCSIDSKILGAKFDFSSDMDLNYKSFIGNIETLYGAKFTNDQDDIIREKFNTEYTKRVQSNLMANKAKKLKDSRKKLALILAPIVLITIIALSFIIKDINEKSKEAAETARINEMLTYWNRKWINQTWAGQTVTFTINENGHVRLEGYSTDLDYSWTNSSACLFDFDDETMTCDYGVNVVDYERTPTGLKSWNQSNSRFEFFVPGK